MTQLPQETREQLRRIATEPVLLVATDFDGTLSSIATRPELARADALALEALAALARLPCTHVAVISGRSLADLRAKLSSLGGLGSVRLIGSHGLESSETGGIVLTPGARSLLDDAVEAVRRIADATPGSLVELKPAGIAFHFRECEPEAGTAAAQQVAEFADRRQGVFRISGLSVIELAVLEPNKGAALDMTRRRLGASAVFFVGDDVTDEAAFRAMTARDVSVKVGSGDTFARHRVESQTDVHTCLSCILQDRSAWLAQRRFVRLEQLAYLSDQRTAALIEPDGGVCWLCLPRLDSPAVFAKVLGGEDRGVFRVARVGMELPTRFAYLPDSLVLQTDWDGLVVTDYLDCSHGRPYQRAGRTDLVRAISGVGRAAVKFAPRLDFGRVAGRIVQRDGGLEVEGWPEPIVLFSPGVAWSIERDGDHQTATAEIDARDGCVLELRHGTANLRPSPLPESQRRELTRKTWAGWVGSLKPPAESSELIRRSALAIRGLVYGPTGAIAAAATTSLPEHLGGVRNWDYRYCWPRDASLAAAALVRLGNTGTAMKLLDWLIAVVERCESPDRLRPIYSLLGGELGSEAEIGELSGYGESRPVRVGNAAALQVQLDVFGPIVDLVALLAERGVPVTPEYWRLVQAMVRAVEQRWREPDHGIWEIRGPRRHHVHSKLMCWVAVNRAIAAAELAVGRTIPEWFRLRDEIAADLLERGWNASLGTFTGSYGGTHLDAAVLLMATHGFLPATDARLRSTVDTIERELRRGPTVLRYVEDDGLPGIEGGMHICTFWLVEALHIVGRPGDARALFEQAVELSGPLGLLSEQFDPVAGLSLGNYPQAYSHLGLIDAAVRLNS